MIHQLSAVTKIYAFGWIVTFSACWTHSADAQQITTQSGLRANGTRFSESFQSSWTYQRPGVTIQFNGGAGGPFGGQPGNPGFTSGFRAGNFQGSFSAGQFSSTNSTSITPVLTTTDGYPGGLFIGTVRPFVVGVQPVVPTSPLLPNFGDANSIGGRLARGEFSIVDGRVVPAQLAFELPPAPAPLDAFPESQPAPHRSPPETAEQLLARGDEARVAGKTAVARIYYQLAAARTESAASLTAWTRLSELSR